MGAENALVISSDDISKKSYIEFFETYGCQWYSGHKDEAIILDEHTQVGVCLMDSSYSEMFDKGDQSEFEVALGAKPKSYFEVNRTKADDPDDLYLVVAREMAKKWRVAVYDIQEKMIPYDALV